MAPYRNDGTSRDLLFDRLGQININAMLQKCRGMHDRTGVRVGSESGRDMNQINIVFDLLEELDRIR